LITTALDLAYPDGLSGDTMLANAYRRLFGKMAYSAKSVKQFAKTQLWSVNRY
jgi:hypothetical protein